MARFQSNTHLSIHKDPESVPPHSIRTIPMDSKVSSLLPFELLEEILCKVPTKSLIRLKLTCKRWLALFKDKRFVYKHLALLQEHIIRTNYTHMVRIINPVNGAISSLSLPHEFELKSEIYGMIHCDGLMLCILEVGPVALWNPCLQKVRWIKPLQSSSPGCYIYGIGYDGLSRDGYKFLKFVNGVFTSNEYSNTGLYKPVVYIYDFKLDSWKIIKGFLDWHVVSRCRSVSLGGNMYWVAKWNLKPDMFIQCFNFSTETFEPLCALPFEYGEDDVVGLSGFRGSNLSLLHQSKETSKIEVWVINKVKNGASTSWTKFFSVTDHLLVLRSCDNLANPVHFIDKNNMIVVCCEELVADRNNVAVNVYLIGEGEIIRQAEIERHQRGFSWPFVSGYAYLPSLVPVPT